MKDCREIDRLAKLTVCTGTGCDLLRRGEPRLREAGPGPARVGPPARPSKSSARCPAGQSSSSQSGQSPVALWLGVECLIPRNLTIPVLWQKIYYLLWLDRSD